MHASHVMSYTDFVKNAARLQMFSIGGNLTNAVILLLHVSSLAPFYVRVMGHTWAKSCLRVSELKPSSRSRTRPEHVQNRKDTCAEAKVLTVTN